MEHDALTVDGIIIKITNIINYFRIIEGKGPKIQLKLESFHLERDLVEDDGENDR